ncbi:MAG: glycoside hydrolase family 26 protein [Candidatus Muiribacteriota bacterium]
MNNIKKCLIFLLVFVLLAGAFYYFSLKRKPVDNFYFGLALEGYPLETSRINKEIQRLRMTPEIINFFLQWPDKEFKNNIQLSKNTLEAVKEVGATPCITWEPMYYIEDEKINVKYDEILNGDYDSYIQDFALIIKKLNFPVMLRFAHEMNLQKYHWGVEEDNYNKEAPLKYIEMYRYIWNKFKRYGAHNVLWVFCPNVDSVPDSSWNIMQNYYPGDEYVDILGLDGYNWGEGQFIRRDGWESKWQSFSHIFSKPLRKLNKITMEKPVMVFETASTAIGGDKTEWLKRAVKKAPRYGFSGIIYFQVDKELDWSINRSQGSVIKDNRLENKINIDEWINQL